MGRILKYLIVEDDTVSVRIVKWELREQGFEVEYDHIENENEMRQKLSEQKYDLIISDHHMPSFSSLEALSIRNEIVPAVPFIVLSIDVPEDIQQQALSNGCTAMVRKDGMSLLGGVIEKLLNTTN